MVSDDEFVLHGNTIDVIMTVSKNVKTFNILPSIQKGKRQNWLIVCSFNSFDKYSTHCYCITYADIRPIMPVINIFDKRVWNFWDSHPNTSKGGSLDWCAVPPNKVCLQSVSKQNVNAWGWHSHVFLKRRKHYTTFIRIKMTATVCQRKYVHVPLLLDKISCIIYQKAVPVMWQKINFP